MLNHKTISDQPWANLYSTALPSTRSGLFFNTFAYPTKISPEAIAVYIAAHTKPGDTVMDVFSGSGSTGLAALMCEHPTNSMKALADKLKLRPQWGPRNAILYEIGKYGAFASQVMANPPEHAIFRAAVKKLIAKTEKTLPGIYDTTNDLGNSGIVRHIIYSDIVSCPHCGEEFAYYTGMVRYGPLRVDRDGLCPCCGYKDVADRFPYVTEDVFDRLLDKQITRRKRVPVKIYGQTGKEKWAREATDDDIQKFQIEESVDYPPDYKPQAIEWGELHRSGYHMGITHLHHFYTKRNFRVMHSLWNGANSFEPRLRDAIKLLLLSYNATHSTLMSRVVVKKNSKDFVLTGAQSGVLYISSLPVEKNIITGIKRKLKAFEEAFAYLNTCSGCIVVNNTSSQHLAEADKSIDYIFTDPPFGDFIPYAEVNQINELWLGTSTERADEIIISPSQKKDVVSYQKMMTDVFGEMKRVLKDSAFATVVFHASKAVVWNALQAAYSDAGFFVEKTTSLTKTQTTFKQTVSEDSVQGDPLILLSKGSVHRSESDSQKVLDEVISTVYTGAEKNERQVYARYIGKCLELGINIDFDAKTAYEYITHKMGAAR